MCIAQIPSLLDSFLVRVRMKHDESRKHDIRGDSKVHLTQVHLKNRFIMRKSSIVGHAWTDGCIDIDKPVL